MEWTRMMKGVRALLDDCTSVQAGEQVLIITDTKLIEIGQVIAAGVHERDAEPIMVVITPRERDGQEPPTRNRRGYETSRCYTHSREQVNHTFESREGSRSGGYPNFGNDQLHRAYDD